MSLFTWLPDRKRVLAGQRRAAHGSPRRQTTFHPQLEALEDRCVPSTLKVTNLNDSGKGSLRYEIAVAQSNDTIVFDFGSKKANSTPQAITLSSGNELKIGKNLTIQGPGAGLLTVVATPSPYNDTSRIFEVGATATVTLSGLTINHGGGYSSVYSTGTGGYEGFGGGVLNFGRLTISGCALGFNFAASGGDGIYNAGTLTVSGSTLFGNSVYGGVDLGGGIYNAGTMSVSASTLTSNQAYEGGGIYNTGTMTVSNCTLSGNLASGGGGGGIYNAGTMTVSASTLTSNHAYGGGGIYNRGTMTVNNCTLSSNLAYFGYGGGMYNAGTATVNGCALSGNAASVEGGDLYNAGIADALIVLNSTFSRNIPDNIFGPYTDGGGNTFI
jgi:hypothetical protein